MGDPDITTQDDGDDTSVGADAAGVSSILPMTGSTPGTLLALGIILLAGGGLLGRIAIRLTATSTPRNPNG